MSDFPRISEAEWDVMRVLWDHHPRTAHEVDEALAGSKRWSVRTVKTLLGRLVKKGAVGYVEEGKRYLYHPLVTRAECELAESRSFLERVGGKVESPLLAYFLEKSDLTPEEIDELRRLLADKEAEQ